jgi:hypothetical protein
MKVKYTATVTDEPFGGAHSGDKRFKLAELLGAHIGAGENCPIAIQVNADSIEGLVIVENNAREKLSAIVRLCDDAMKVMAMPLDKTD